MHLDVTELRAFYDTILGQMARRILRRRIRDLWPDVTGLRVLGFGYVTPYLRPYLGDAERVLAFMPGAQGVIAWPRRGPNLTALTEDCDLPLPDGSIDRVLIVHGLEVGETVRPLLREVWRVLAPGGRVLIVAPNRRSLWAQIESTPFGTGRPFTRRQLMRLLRDQMFTPTQWDAALHFWPVRQAFLLRWAPYFERFGAQWMPGFAGVHLVEASKQIYGLVDGLPERAKGRAMVLVSQPALQARANGHAAAAAPSQGADDFSRRQD
jgi:SAM-dependent methyltransferase